MPVSKKTTEFALFNPANVVQEKRTWRTLLPWLVPIAPAVIVLLLWASTR